MGDYIKTKLCPICKNLVSEIIDEKFGTPIEKLGLSHYARNCLLRRDIETVEQLIKLTKDELMRFCGIGKKTFAKIKQRVKEFGFDCW